MTIVEAVLIVVRLLVRCCVIHVVLGVLLLQDGRIHYLRLTWHSFRRRVLAVRAHIHVIVVLLFQRWPSLLTDQRTVVLVFSIFLEEGL